MPRHAGNLATDVAIRVGRRDARGGVGAPRRLLGVAIADRTRGIREKPRVLS